MVLQSGLVMKYTLVVVHVGFREPLTRIYQETASDSCLLQRQVKSARAESPKQAVIYFDVTLRDRGSRKAGRKLPVVRAHCCS
jgi:hypothetical protein